MPTAIASVTTDRPGPYLRQLCKHFAHGTEAEFGDTAGHIVLGTGRCELDASEGDRLRLTATGQDAEDLERVTRVIGDHLERFGRRDGLRIAWRVTAGRAA